VIFTDLSNSYQTLVVALSFPKSKKEDQISFTIDVETLYAEDKERLLKPRKLPSQLVDICA
jgi:hypothetical protein